jgi:hypothetical protein
MTIVGRQGFDAFDTPSKTLEEIIGTQMGFPSSRLSPYPTIAGFLAGIRNKNIGQQSSKYLSIYDSCICLKAH